MSIYQHNICLISVTVYLTLTAWIQSLEQKVFQRCRDASFRDANIYGLVVADTIFNIQLRLAKLFYDV